MVKCEKCGNDIRRGANFYDDEIVCEKCGATYCLEYLGYYPEGSTDDSEMIGEGHEDKEWIEQCKKMKGE